MLVTVGVALVAVALSFASWTQGPSAPQPGSQPVAQAAQGSPGPSLAAQARPSVAGDREPSRRVYRHSVVPGGVHTPAEVLRAIAGDPVVAAHYAGLDTSRLRVERLAQPLSAHVSYRIGDQVYWTGRKLQLPAGEEVLTDGETSLRARCGNLISTVRRTPTFAGEPEEAEFDLTIEPLALDVAQPMPLPAPKVVAFQPRPPAAPPPREPARRVVAIPAPSALVLLGFAMVVGVMGYLCRRIGLR
jgi:hypothetical protein